MKKLQKPNSKIIKKEDTMKLYIKNMVCNRCIMVVRTELEKLGFSPIKIALGEVEFLEALSTNDKIKIGKQLQIYGFELMNDKKSRIIGQIKSSIIHLVHHENCKLKNNLSDYLVDKLNYNYKYLSTLFSEKEGVSIEKYFFSQKIERVKEFLTYDEFSLGEIATMLNYSSVAYLSNQFKKITGVTPSAFKKTKTQKRKALDKL